MVLEILSGMGCQFLRRLMSASWQEDCPAFSIFSLLWAVAALFHIVWANIFIHSAPFTTPRPLLSIVLSLAAAAVVQRPSSIRRLLILAGVQVLDVGYEHPYCSNHWLLSGFVNLTIIGSAAWVKSQAWREPLRFSDVYETFTPFVRLEVIIFYFFTFFHKLNADFIDPSSSCAVTLLNHIISLFSLPSGPTLEYLVIFLTLGVECFLVIGLAIPRLWLPAVLIGVGFHFILALDVVKLIYTFSAPMYALLWVFVPPSAAVHLARAPQRLAESVQGKPVRTRLVWLFFNRFHFLAAYLLTLILCWHHPQHSLILNVLGFTCLWLIFAVTLFVSLGLAWETLREQTADRPPGPRAKTSFLLLLPFLVFLNGLGPYLGLKLKSAWQMYSNLSVDHSGSNHFLVPYSLDVGGFLADSVAIVSTSDSLLDKRYVQTGNRITYFELRGRLARQPDVQIAYVRAGQKLRNLPRAGDSPEFSDPGSPLLRRLLVFRPLGPQAGKVCAW